ncbi:hypothetical protein EK904_004286 [Melospiza melodia maxima]|nr:hypothetical protein EK904_004286 [Melospiza melodia maxima]
MKVPEFDKRFILNVEIHLRKEKKKIIAKLFFSENACVLEIIAWACQAAWASAVGSAGHGSQHRGAPGIAVLDTLWIPWAGGSREKHTWAFENKVELWKESSREILEILRKRKVFIEKSGNDFCGVNSD